MEGRPRIETYPQSFLEATAESKEAFSRLQEYAAQGYLFHGSKSRVEVLEPRQARDGDGTRKLTNMRGVYATDHIEIPVFMALKAPQDAEKSWTSGYSHNHGDETFSMHGNNTVLTPGWVHVLPRDTFEVLEEGGSNETVSMEPVRPIASIEVKPDILRLFPNIDLDLSGKD
jgi:hypothetical protein